MNQSSIISDLINNLPAILTALGAVITATGVIVLGILNYRRTGQSIAQSKTNENKIDEVHTVVNDTSNSNAKELSRVTQALGVANEKIEKHLSECVDKDLAERLEDCEEKNK